LRELRGKRFWSRLVVLQTEDKQASSNFQYKQVPSEARHAGKRRFSIFLFKKNLLHFFTPFLMREETLKIKTLAKYQWVIYGRNESC